MEVVDLKRRTDGKVIPTDEQKRRLLGLLDQGYGIAEVARSHQITVQTIVKWRRADVKRASGYAQPGAVPVQLSEHDARGMQDEIRRILDENQKLRKSIGNIAYDRDILQEAYNIAVKKKWI